MRTMHARTMWPAGAQMHHEHGMGECVLFVRTIAGKVAHAITKKPAPRMAGFASVCRGDQTLEWLRNWARVTVECNVEDLP